jgi:4-hydroxy-4-methyl-2-oxoglutarate aldolase
LFVFEINQRDRTIPEELISAYSKISTATMGHRIAGNAMDSGIRMLAGEPIVVGPAITVRTLGRDSTVLHRAFDLVVPGDVIVIDRGGDDRYACWGEMMSLAAKLRGAAGVIIDGAATDVAELRSLGMPVFARVLSPLTTLLLGEGGSINVPVQCGGLEVLPGSLVVADEDGVLVLGLEEANTLLGAFEAEAVGDKTYRDQLLSGRLPSELMPTGLLSSSKEL